MPGKAACNSFVEHNKRVTAKRFSDTYLGSRNPEQTHQSAMRTLKPTMLAMTTLAILCFIFARTVSVFVVGDPVVGAAAQFM